MAQWYKVYWQSSTGQQKTTMTRNPNRAQRKIMGTGGRVYKVVQPYASRRKYPKAKIGEDREKIITERIPIPTKTRSPLSKKEGMVKPPKTTTTKKIMQYKHQLTRIIISPYATPEQKQEARMQLARFTTYGKKGYKIKSVPSGFEFYKEEKPHEPVAWSKKQLKGIEESKHPPFIKELALLGFYGGQTVMAVGQPLINVFKNISGIKSPYRHHVSWFDVVGEPLGMSPKGSTELLGKHPYHALIGGGLVEVPLMYGFGQASKSAGKGLTLGTKSIVRKTPHVFYKVTKEFGLPKTLQKIAYQPKFQTFWQNLYSYSTGASKFVKTFPIVKGPPQTYRSLIGERIVKATKFKGFGRTELVSIQQYGLIKERMGTSGTVFFRYTPGAKIEGKLFMESIGVKGIFRKTITVKYASMGKSIWAGNERLLGGISYATHVHKQMYRPMVSTGMHHAGYLGGQVVSVPLSASLPLTASLSAVGSLSVHALANEMKQGSAGLSINKILLKRLSAYESISLQTGLTKSLFSEMQKQMMVQKTKTITIPQTKIDISTTHRGKGITPVSFGFHTPKISWWFGSERTRKKKKPFMDISPIKLSYHERVHPSRDIEKQLNIKGFTKSFSTDINKEMSDATKEFKL